VRHLVCSTVHCVLGVAADATRENSHDAEHAPHVQRERASVSASVPRLADGLARGAKFMVFFRYIDESFLDQGSRVPASSLAFKHLARSFLLLWVEGCVLPNTFSFSSSACRCIGSASSYLP